MKYPVALFFLLVLACGCNRNKMIQLLEEQKLLKDSANTLNEKIGDYLRKGISDSAAAQKKQLGAVHTRLTAIQYSIDSLGKMK